jgi:RES domain-containing protein
MGFAKSMAIEAEDRGYGELDTFVCDECVEDEFLKNVIRAASQVLNCDYCGRASEDCIAAPASVLIELIAETVNNYFCEPGMAGVPYEGGYLIEAISTHEMLDHLGFECRFELFKDMVSVFNNDFWVPAADGHWASSHERDILHSSWSLFCREVQHRTRFFFGTADLPGDAEPQDFAPKSMLPTLGRLVNTIDLVRSLGKGHLLSRVREKPIEVGWMANSDSMGAPPPEHARAGRMNPAGISYLYLAYDQATAVSEVARSLPANLVIATFEVRREIRVLDLSTLPELPSIFDVDQIMIREGLLFLERFVTDISKRVVKDGSEHVEYVPSQVICEYFAQIYTTTDGRGLDGLVYPSALLPGGRNLVLFPSERGHGAKFDSVAFSGATEVACKNLLGLAALVAR